MIYIIFAVVFCILSLYSIHLSTKIALAERSRDFAHKRLKFLQEEFNKIITESNERLSEMLQDNIDLTLEVEKYKAAKTPKKVKKSKKSKK